MIWRAIAWVIGIFLAVTVLPVLALRWVHPPTSAFMVQAKLDSAQSARRGNRIRYQWVDFKRISPDAGVAVVAAEDQNFPAHHGFDLKSIQDALRENETRKRPRGASTISQQVAKNLFLWSGRSFVRKGLEAWFTLLIETMWPKQRVLEVYLNIAQFGPGVYGVEAAGRQYFGKPAARLNASEAALLAAVLPNPRRLRVDRPSRYVSSRQEWILEQMSGLGGRGYLGGLQK